MRRGPQRQQRPVADRPGPDALPPGHQATKDYVARRTAEGKTKTEILRCLKRYIARETYLHLTALATTAASHAPGRSRSPRATETLDKKEHRHKVAGKAAR